MCVVIVCGFPLIFDRTLSYYLTYYPFYVNSYFIVIYTVVAKSDLFILSM